jgi:anti-anti-sigma factor
MWRSTPLERGKAYDAILMADTPSEVPGLRSSTTYAAADAHLALAGEFDMASSLDINGIVADLIARNCLRLIVDLATLSFIDSSGISELVKLHAALQRADIALSTLAPNASTYRIFELCGLVEELQVTAT